MSRYSLVLLAGLWAAGPAGAASWADALFDSLSKDFGSVPRGPTLTHRFTLTNNTGSPVNISNLRVSCGCVTATALKGFLNPGEDTAVVAHMDTTRFTGVRAVTIYVQFDRPRFEEVRLWVQANARNDFALTPDSLAFGRVKRTATPSASVRLTLYGQPEARVTEVHAESTYVRPACKELGRTASEVVYELSATLRPDTPVGRWYTDVWLKTNLASLPQVRVPLTVEVESPLSVSPESVNLGTLKLNESSERRIILRGVKPFKVTRFDGTDAHLTARASTTGAREVHVLTVQLKGARPGDLARTLRVHTDLGGADTSIDFRVHARVNP
jgi:hypothetical protein